MRANIDGTEIMEVVDAETSIDDIAVSNEGIFWTAFNRDIYRVDHDGTNRTKVIAGFQLGGVAVSNEVVYPSLSISREADQLRIFYDGVLEGSSNLSSWQEISTNLGGSILSSETNFNFFRSRSTISN